MRAGLAAAGIGCVVVAASARKLPLAIASAAFVLAGTAIGVARLEAIDHSELRPLIGRSVTARGYVVKRERPTPRARRFRLRLEVVSAGAATAASPGGTGVGEVVQVQVRAGVALRSMAIGDEAVVRGALEQPVRRPDSSFDYAEYLRRAGVHALLYADSVRLTGRRRGGLTGIVDAMRRRAEAGVARGLDPQMAALAHGMVLGEDERISATMTDDFKASGLAHLLAVSGQNVTLLALLAVPVLAAAGLGRRARLLAVLALIAAYVPLTGAGPSIMRAGAMGAAGTVAALAGRPASRWYALLLAGAFTVAVEPRAWLDPGWQLSFAAVVGIFLLTRPLTRALRRLPSALAAGFAVTAAATVATAPLMAFHFERVSLVSLFANLLALPVVAPIMWAGMLAAAIAQVWVAPAALLNALDGYCLGYLASVAHSTARLPSAVLAAHLRSPVSVAFTYAGMLACLLGLARIKRVVRVPGPARRRVAAAIAVALAATMGAAVGWAPWSAGVAAPGGFTVSFLDVGQGDAILLQTPAGSSVLVDGGPPTGGIVSKLRARGVKALDLAVLTHAQEDHQGGLEPVFRSFRVRVLLDGGFGGVGSTHRRVVSLARRQGTAVLAPRRGETLRIGRLRLRVLNPERAASALAAPESESGDPNDRAIVLLASFGGIDVLLPSDAESNVTLSLPLPQVEVLKVAHHGSADDELPALLDRLHPELAVIEVGARNPFGHPTPETLRTLISAIPRVFRTDRDGDVTVSYDRYGATVSTEN
jgi:competence protein ComEC